MKIDRRPRPERKYIPLAIRVRVAERQFLTVELLRSYQLLRRFRQRLEWLLKASGLKQPRLDHRPALIRRPINRRGDDYVPPQLDPKAMEYVEDDEHQRRTTGRSLGAAATHTTKGSDAWYKAKFDRLEGRTKKRPKRPIPQRRQPWPKGRKLRSRPWPKK